jgi:hypothetical protein
MSGGGSSCNGVGKQFASHPDYGSGAGGWGEDLSLAGNRLDRLGVGAAEERGETSFYAWLLGQARDLDASLFLSALPE